MTIEHEVWAKAPGHERVSYQQTFDLSRWQWAEKLARYLRDKGFTEVEVRLEVDEDEDDDDDLETEECDT